MSDDRGTVPFNAGWLFGAFTDGCELPGFDDGAFAPVTLPHTVAPLSWQDWDPASWELVWAYRKRFDAPPGHDGQRVGLYRDVRLRTASGCSWTSRRP
jgi:beta-galactosidase